MTAAEDKIAQLASLLVEQLPAAIGQTVIDNGGQLLPHAASSAQREIDADLERSSSDDDPGRKMGCSAWLPPEMDVGTERFAAAPYRLVS